MLKIAFIILQVFSYKMEVSSYWFNQKPEMKNCNVSWVWSNNAELFFVIDGATLLFHRVNKLEIDEHSDYAVKTYSATEKSTTMKYRLTFVRSDKDGFVWYILNAERKQPSIILRMNRN